MFITDYTHPDGGYEVGEYEEPIINLGELINEDGTVFNPPKNPLMDKWLRLYPPSERPEYSQVCDGYSCMWCSRCPHGDKWQVPEEDLVEYNKYRNNVEAYLEEHNPSLANI